MNKSRNYFFSIAVVVFHPVMWRVWQEMDESEPAAEPTLIPFPSTKASMDFTVMSYNILAQDLLEAHEELYVHCPLEVLDWSYRCSLVLEEIMKWAPDVSLKSNLAAFCFIFRHPVMICVFSLVCVDTVSPRSSGKPLPRTAVSTPV